MADDIDEIMAMIEGMQTQDKSMPLAEKENIRYYFCSKFSVVVVKF